MNRNHHISPPVLPLKFLRWFCDRELLEDVEGDLCELFESRIKESKARAKLKFIIDVMMLFRPGIIKSIDSNNKITNYAMLRNYLKIIGRNALRYKGHTALNLLGLVVGIASSILILLWVNDEIQVDKFHVNGDKIYQLYRNMKQADGMTGTTSSIPKPAADLMKAEYPEVASIASLSWQMNTRLAKGESYSMEDGHFATQEFLTMFTFDFLEGDKNTALTEVNAIVISETLANKHFGTDWKGDIIGQTLKTEEDMEVVIKGVFKDLTDQSTLQFDWLQSAEYFYSQNPWVNNWGNGSFRVYFTLNNPEDAEVVAKRVFSEILDHTQDNDMAGDETLIMHKFADNYLYSNFDNGVVSGGRIDYVRIMTVVAILILVVACINYMNLATARSSRRSKEIGLRKVMGAPKKSIRFQFFFESILLSVLAVLLSVVLVILILPLFNEFVDKSLAIDFTVLRTWYFLGGVALTVGILSGSYPAFLLPTFNIISSLKGTVKQSPSSAILRKGLVVFQFGISTLLIIGTAVIYKQLDYVLTKDLGLEKENLIGVWMEGDLSQRLLTYQAELKKIPQVKSVSAASGNPISYGRSTSSASWEGKDPEAGYEVNVLLTDENFVNTMGMEIISGRDFSEQVNDSTNFIINEVFADLMGFDDPIGKKLSFWGINGTIVGLVKNFHMSNLRDPIAPLIISCIIPTRSELALIRFDGNQGEALLAVEELTKELNPKFDFQYEIIEDNYADSYDEEQTISSLANIFAMISIFISSLGLLGLSSYTAERRSKEIGVRKVHGASILQILVLLTKDYSKLMLLAFLLAIPFGYYYAQNWLENFEFRTNLDPFLFFVGGLITFFIGVFTVASKSYQAANTNPVKTLRDE